MLFFRSEELVRGWCDARGVTPRPLVGMHQLWALATKWYSGRLELESRRPKPEEMRGIFAEIGLVGEFWDPTGDWSG